MQRIAVKIGPLKKGVKELRSHLKRETKTTEVLQFIKILFTEKLWKLHEPI